MAGAVEVRGLAELQRTFRALPAATKLRLQKELRAVGEIVAADARPRLAGLNPSASGATVSGIRPRSRVGLVAVAETRGRTTGLRPDWGRTVMARGLEPALDARTGEIEVGMELMLDRLFTEYGF